MQVSIRDILPQLTQGASRFNDRRVVESIVSVQKPNDVWEMDIMYVYIHGENRTAYLFAIIDCYTREDVGKYIGYHCSSQKVKMAIDFAFLDRGIMQIKNVRIRSDNGTQFVSRIVELFLSSCNIAHERIHPATPKEDAHIESFNSILEKEVIRRFEFSSFEDAENTISRFIAFYNNERLHSAMIFFRRSFSFLSFRRPGSIDPDRI